MLHWKKKTKLGTLNIGTNGSRVMNVTLNNKTYTNEEDIKNILKTLNGSYLSEDNNYKYDSTGKIIFINADVSEKEIECVEITTNDNNSIKISKTIINLENLSTSYSYKQINFD